MYIAVFLSISGLKYVYPIVYKDAVARLILKQCHVKRVDIKNQCQKGLIKSGTP